MLSANFHFASSFNQSRLTGVASDQRADAKDYEVAYFKLCFRYSCVITSFEML